MIPKAGVRCCVIPTHLYIDWWSTWYQVYPDYSNWVGYPLKTHAHLTNCQNSRISIAANCSRYCSEHKIFHSFIFIRFEMVKKLRFWKMCWNFELFQFRYCLIIFLIRNCVNEFILERNARTKNLRIYSTGTKSQDLFLYRE